MKQFSKYINKSWENRVPISAVFEVTKKCNFKCSHCYLDHVSHASYCKDNELTFQEWKKIIDYVDDAGVRFVEITGGEPFMRKDILEIIKYARQKDFILSVFSNGSMIDESIIQELKKLKIMYIAYSIHGHNAEIHDKITGIKGSFEKVINAVKLSKEYGLHTIVKCSIGKPNYEYLEEIISLGEILKVPLQLGYLIMNDLNGKTPKLYQITDKSALNKVIKRINKYNTKNEAPQECNVFNYKNDFRCAGLITAFCIDSSGNMLPCPGINYNVGNILKDDFNILWSNKKTMAFVNRKKPIECNNCELNKNCSPCAAYLINSYGHFKNIDEYICTINREILNAMTKK